MTSPIPYVDLYPSDFAEDDALYARADGDVLLFHTQDGGDIEVIRGWVSMHRGFVVAAYLSMFGGNPGDNGGPKSTERWWGNLLEDDDDHRIVSRTYNVILETVPIPANLRRVEQAARLDLEWMLSRSICKEITPVASIPDLNWLALDIQFVGDLETVNERFLVHWRAQTT